MLDQEISLRIIVENAPPRIRWMSQLGPGELVAPTSVAGNTFTFDFVVRAIHSKTGALDFRGKAVQGKLGERFVYLNSESAPDARGFDRRAKIHLKKITMEQIEKLAKKPNAILQTRFHGTSKDGGAACASVPLLGGWEIVASAK
ncbi:MAG: DUF5990 family protein [Gemmatimonadaceae bacterium]